MIIEDIMLEESRRHARDQGDRPTCLAFAVTDLNRRFAPEELGPEYFYQAAVSRIPGWVPGDGLQVDAAESASVLGQATEKDFPYQSTEPQVPIAPLPEELALYGRQVRFFPPEMENLIESLQKGYPIGLGLQLTYDFYQPLDGVIGYSESAMPGMLHAVLAVGLGYDEETTPWFYIRNSWGKAWGNQGHAWISGTYISTHASCAFGVDYGDSDSV